MGDFTFPEVAPPAPRDAGDLATTSGRARGEDKDPGAPPRRPRLDPLDPLPLFATAPHPTRAPAVYRPR